MQPKTSKYYEGMIPDAAHIQTYGVSSVQFPTELGLVQQHPHLIRAV